jgi:hypothetical protein
VLGRAAADEPLGPVDAERQEHEAGLVDVGVVAVDDGDLDVPAGEHPA